MLNKIKFIMITFVSLFFYSEKKNLLENLRYLLSILMNELFGDLRMIHVPT